MERRAEIAELLREREACAIVAKGHELLLSELEAKDPCAALPKELLRSAESILNRLAKLDDELRELGIDLRGKRM